MAVVKMNKIAVLGLSEERSDLLKSLMKLGVVEINQEEPDGELQDRAYNPNVQADLTKIDSCLAEVARALDILSRYAPVKKPMFSARRIVSEADYEHIVQSSQEIFGYVNQINRCEDEIFQLKSDENRLKSMLGSLDPWLGLDIPLEIENTRYTYCYTGSLPAKVDLKAIEDALYGEFPESILLVSKSDENNHYIAVIGLKTNASEEMEMLKSWGWNRIILKDGTGTAKERKEALSSELEALYKKWDFQKALIHELAAQRENIEVLFDSYRMTRSRMEAQSRLVSTKSAFLLRGWLPADMSEKVEDYLNRHFFCVIEIEQPAPDETFPVQLKNGPIVEAISPIINMYGLPSSLEIDPSAVTLPFYVFIFGLMLGDGGYGLIIALVTGFILKKFRLEDSTRKFLKLLFLCGLSTILAGFLFGSWFGIGAFTKNALWIVPTEQPELMMSYAILIGIIHMYAGLFMKALNLIRRRQVLDAIFDVGFTYVMFTGFILSLLPFAPGISVDGSSTVVTAGHYIFVVGVALVLVTNGRKSKSIFGKIFGGLPRLYDIVSFFSDCLSYTRILALGLASSIIGDIVNTLAMSFDSNIIVKVILVSVVLVFGHTMNFLLNALGAYVHSCRLQFLEFFGKFLEGGGQAYKPLKADTKYIVVKFGTSVFLNSGVEPGTV